MAESKQSEIKNILESKGYILSGGHVLSEKSQSVSFVDGNILIGPPEGNGKTKYIFFGKTHFELSREEYHKIEDLFLEPLENAGFWDVIIPSVNRARIERNLDHRAQNRKDFNEYIDKLKHSNTNIKLYIEDECGEIKTTDSITLTSREFFTYPYITESPYHAGFKLRYPYSDFKEGFDLQYGIQLCSCDGFKSMLNISSNSHKILNFKLEITNVTFVNKQPSKGEQSWQ